MIIIQGLTLTVVLWPQAGKYSQNGLGPVKKKTSTSLDSLYIPNCLYIYILIDVLIVVLIDVLIMYL